MEKTGMVLKTQMLSGDFKIKKKKSNLEVKYQNGIS